MYELIEKFINENLPALPKNADIREAFEEFWQREEERYLKKVAEENNLEEEKLGEIVSEFLQTKKMPLGSEIIKISKRKPGILQRNRFTKKIQSNLKSFARIFSW